MTEKLGIDNLKKALIAAINLAKKIEKNYTDDGKISFVEVLGIGASSFGDILRVIKSGSEIKAEFINLDDNEKDELIQFVKDEFDLENDKIENIVEKSLEFLVGLDELIKSIK